MPLWLVRHAQPLVATGVCYGALDLPADPQATASAAQHLAQQLAQGITVHYSPLQRCELLVQHLLGLRADLACKPVPQLREMDFGHWEGKRWDAIAPAELAAWTDDFENYRCGAVGETTAEFVRRVHSALLATVPAPDVSALPPSTPTVWVTHAGVMRATLWLRQQGWLSHPCGQTLPPVLGLRASDWPQDALGFGQSLQVAYPAQSPE
jgi:alpha-ribazole phosphatase